jgi:hypothetical protein
MNPVIEANLQMMEHISKINDPDNDRTDIIYHSTRAICTGLACVVEELAAIRRELEGR